MLSTPELVVAPPLERTDEWLRQELHYIWSNFFRDIAQANQVEISFARTWKSRLGLIRLSESGHHTYIGINRLLRHHHVPDEVVSITVAHELVHYSHGFGSPLPRKYRHPHHGDIVTQELNSRGLAAELEVFTEWTTIQWYNFYYSNVPQRRNGHSNNGHSVIHDLGPRGMGL